MEQGGTKPNTWGITKCFYHDLLLQKLSLLHLMCANACTHASTRTISLMHVKNSRLLFMTPVVWYIEMKKMKERTKTSNWTVDNFSLTFVILHAWLQNKGKILSLEWIIQSAWDINIYKCIFKRFCVSLLEPYYGKTTYVIQRHIQNSVKHLRWSDLQKQSMAKSF